MNEDQLELRVASWLAAGPTVAPDRIARHASAFAIAHPRRRRGWRDLFAGGGVLLRPTSVALRPLVVLALLALTFALGAVFYAAWHNNAVVPQPTPTVQPSPGPAGFACPPGSEPGVPGAPDQARPARAVRAQIAVDSESNVVVYAADGAIWAFDLCTNTWRFTGHTFSRSDETTAVAYDADSDRIVIVAGGLPQSVTAVYDANSNTVTEAGYRRTDPLQSPAAVYDPTTGLVIVRDGSELWTYRLETDEWRELAQLGDIPPAFERTDAHVLAYDQSVGRLVLYAVHADAFIQPTAATYEFDLRSSTWYRQRVDTPALEYPLWEALRFSGTYDALRQRTVFYNNGRLIAYDATRQEWSVLSDEPGIESTSLGVALAYDPNGGRVIALGANPLGRVQPLSGSDWTRSNDVAALDLQSATWTELLAGAVTPAYDPTPVATQPLP